MTYVHSYTALRTYTECPQRFRAVYLDRSVPKSPPTPAMERGNVVHKQIERAVKTGAPADVWTPDNLIHLLRTGNASAELGLGIDRSGLPCDPFAPGVLLRGWIDAAIIEPGGALLIDWKTGQFRPDDLQADVYATLARAGRGDDYPVSFGWIYVDLRRAKLIDVDRHAGKRVYELLDRIERDTTFNPVPSHACRWCPVTTCTHNRSK